MTCDESQRRIAALGATEPLPADLAVHLESCDDCASALAAERHVRAALAAAPWPDSPLTWDLARLRARAEAAEAEAVRTRRRRLLAGIAGIGVLAVLGGLTAPAVLARKGVETMDPAILVALLVAGAAVWVALDVAGRRMAAAGASNASLAGLGAARAGLAAALILALLHPETRPALDALLWPDAGHPAAADQTVFEATLVCVSRVDGRYRGVTWSEGCGEDEYAVRIGASGFPSTAAMLPTVEYRAGTVVIPAGQSFAYINFSRPMLTADYPVALTVAGSQGPFASDEACRVVMVAGKDTRGFGVMFRRCWYEGEDVPTDPAKNELTLDWIAIEQR